MVLTLGHFLQVFRKTYRTSNIADLGVTIKLHGGLLKNRMTYSDADLLIYETRPLVHSEAERVADFVRALKNKLGYQIEENWNMMTYGPTLTLVDHGQLANHVIQQ